MFPEGAGGFHDRLDQIRPRLVFVSQSVQCSFFKWDHISRSSWRPRL